MIVASHVRICLYLCCMLLLVGQNKQLNILSHLILIFHLQNHIVPRRNNHNKHNVLYIYINI